MPEFDIVVPSLTLKAEAIFKAADLYKIAKQWCSKNRYNFAEIEYEDKLRENVSLIFEAKKNIDDYTKFVIECKLKINDIKQVDVNSKKQNKANVDLKIKSYMQSDRQNRWNKPISRIIRDVYDKLVNLNKMNEYSKQLEKDTKNIYNEIKSFLNIHKV